MSHIYSLPIEESILTHCTPETGVNTHSHPDWKITSLSHSRRKIPLTIAVTAFLLRLLYFNKSICTQFCFAAQQINLNARLFSIAPPVRVLVYNFVGRLYFKSHTLD